MDERDSRAFIECLNEMGEFFADELSELRQRTYWRLLGAGVSLPEWRYACDQAMCRETFHKTPLPASLLLYIEEYRQEERDAAQDALRQQTLAIEMERNKRYNAQYRLEMERSAEKESRGNGVNTTA